MKIFLFLYVFHFLSGLNLSAQEYEPVRWEFEVNKLNENIYELKLIANVNGAWKLFAPGNNPAGGKPLRFTYENTENFEKIGKPVFEPQPVIEYDDILLTDIVYFKGRIEFKEIVRLKKKEPILLKISGQAERYDKSVSTILNYEHSFTFNKKDDE